MAIQTELFERGRELLDLEEAFAATRAGRGCLALITGEAGIGKTALVRHFVDRQARSVPCYWGACDALFTPRPLGPFSDIASQMQSELLPTIESSFDWHRAATAF